MNKKTIIHLLGMLLTIASPALGQSSACIPPATDSIRLESVDLVGGVLFASVYWPAGPPAVAEATIEILDRGNGVVSATTVVPDPGLTVEYQLTYAPDFFVTHGYWFTFRIVDSGGFDLASRITGLVSLCPSGQGCTYQISEGLDLSGLIMSPELFSLLDDLEAAGSTNLLGDALVLRPDLEHEIYWAGDQMARVRPPSKLLGCSCQWVSEVNLTPFTRHETVMDGDAPAEDADPDWRLVSVAGAGPNLLLSSQLLGGRRLELSEVGYGAAGLHLRCQSTTTWTVVTWSGQTFSFPILGACPTACPDARVSVSAFAATRALANAQGSVDHGAFASASASTAFFADEQSLPFFTASVEVETKRSPGDFDLTAAHRESGYQGGGWWALGRDLDLLVRVDADVETCLQAFGPVEGCQDDFVRPAADDGSWAYSCSESTVGATLTGEASCADEPSQVVSFSSLILRTKDGALILPWRP